MKLSQEHKLFIVEFGKPDVGSFSFYTPAHAPIYIIAKSYDDAASKATVYIEEEVAENKQSVIGPDGSLNIQTDAEYKSTIKAIKLASNRIIM